MSIQKEQIIDAISQMTVLELSELVKGLEEKFGVKAQPAFAPAFIPQQQATTTDSAPEKAEEQTVFNVILASAGEKKIQVIKVVREITKLGLKEAKDLVEGAPKPVREGVSKEEAESIKKKLEEQGAIVEIK